MIKHFLKILFRNFRRNKIYSLINIAGLSIALACCLMIFLWVTNELSFDTFHEKSDRIGRVYHDLTLGGNSRVSPVGCNPMIMAVERYAEIENGTRILQMPVNSIDIGEKSFSELEAYYVDASFFDVFSFELVQGEAKEALKLPHTLVITESTARRFFGDENPVNKIVKLNSGQDYTITAVVRDVPVNSHFRFDMIGSYQTLYAEDENNTMDMWGRFDNSIYFLISDGSRLADAETRLNELVDENLGEVLKSVGGSIKIYLQPLADIHLYSEFSDGIGTTIDIGYVYLFASIACFVLFIAGINFINLTTARTETRHMEIGIKKSLGAMKSSLVFQFLFEAVLYSLMATVLAVIIMELTLPLFNSLADRQLALDYLGSIWIIPALIAFAVLVGLISGLYPAFYQAAFRPISILKGTLFSSSRKSTMRHILVVFQFVISVVLIFGTLIIYNQINYMKNIDLGIEAEQTIAMPISGGSGQYGPETIKQELLTVPGVNSIGLASSSPGNLSLSMRSFIPEGFTEEESVLMAEFQSDHDFIPALGIEILEGRNFSDEIGTDVNDAIIINETAAKKFGWENAVGKTIRQGVRSPEGRQYATLTVIGVVKDFHFFSVKTPIEPVVINYAPYDQPMAFNAMVARLETDNLSQTIAGLEGKWDELNPGQALNYVFINEAFDRMYREEERIGQIVFYFCLLAITISCLGLFGLSAFYAEKRRKEIGIRKILGASMTTVVNLMVREMVVLTAIGVILAWPLAYYIMDKWLQDFAYRINIGLSPFALSGILALMIALLTVLFQSVRAARTNPVEAIKYE